MKIEKLGNITLVHGDCCEYMAGIEENYFDLAICDVPYGIGEDGSKNHKRGKCAKPKKYKAFYGNDMSSPSVEYFNKLFSITKNQIIWGANHFISKIQFDSSCWIVWDKDNGDTDFADCELAWTSFTSSVRKFKFRWNGMLQENMKNKEIRIHPTQKPVALYKWLLTKYAKPGMRILDTHGGSMSHAIAAHDLGFDLTIIEKDDFYYEEAKKRLIEHQKQLTLW